MPRGLALERHPQDGWVDTFSSNDISVLLTHYVDAELERRHGSERTIEKYRANRRIQADILDILNNGISSLSRKVPFGPESKPYGLVGDGTADPTYLRRVAEISIERLHAGPDAPSLRISPNPVLPDTLRGINFGLVFSAETIYFQDTVLALQTDEEGSRPEGALRINVLGIRADWLARDGRGARRALHVDGSGRIREVGFEKPLPLDIIGVSHLPRVRERALHEEISCTCARAGIEQINPYETSLRADDKAWTHRLWGAQGIPAPTFCVIPRRSEGKRILSLLREFLKTMWRTKYVDIVLQPNTGTEGAGVERFRIQGDEFRTMDGMHPAVLHAASLASSDDVLVREARGNVRFLSPDGGYRTVTFRINVAWNGRGFVAESGYAQVAPEEETFVASRGRGGEIVGIGDALSNLWRLGPRGWERLILRKEEIGCIKRRAVEAVEALHSGLDEGVCLKLVGVDVLLEVGALPIALEVNPRPAGLAQSGEIPEILNVRGKPRISVGLFEYMRKRSIHFSQRRKESL